MQSAATDPSIPNAVWPAANEANLKVEDIGHSPEDGAVSDGRPSAEGRQSRNTNASRNSSNGGSPTADPSANASMNASDRVFESGATFRKKRSVRLSIVSRPSGLPSRRASRVSGTNAGPQHWAVPPFVTTYTGLALLVGLSWLSAYFVLGKDILPPAGPVWATFLIWISAHVGAILCTFVKLPKLLGMLVAGIVLKNIPGDPVQGLPGSWSTVIRSMGLSMILTRSGLELDIAAFLQVGAMAARLTALPGVSEALAVSLIVIPIFGMQYFLGLSLGFILGAVSPAVVVVGMFDLQKRGYGVSKGIPSLVVAAASFDDVLAITGFSLAIGLAVPQGNLAWELMHGPLNVIFGLAAGAIGTAVCALTLIWDTRFYRTLIVLILSQCMMLGALKAHFSGAGALGGLMLGAGCSWCWKKGWPKQLALGPDEHYAHETEADLAWLWGLLAQPLLFGVIGTAVNFSELDAATIPKALAVIGLGVTVRLSMAFVACLGGKLVFKERLFIALSWIPKATVQAALASVPADLIDEYMADKPDYLKYKAWGQAIITISVFSIILTAPVGLIIINLLGPRWLSREEDELEGVESPTNQSPSSMATLKLMEQEDGVQVRVTRPSLGGSQLVPVSSARPVDDIVEVDDVDLKQLLTQLANQLEAGVADIPNPDAAERHMNSVELLRQGIGRMEVKKETQPTMDTAGAFFQMSRRGTVVGGSRRATINPMSLIRGNSVGGEVLFTNATPRDAENSGSPSTQGK